MTAKCEECGHKFENPKKEKTKYGTLQVCPECKSVDWGWENDEDLVPPLSIEKEEIK